MKQQTAVEWLYDRFLFAGYAVPSNWKEQAKQMEKDQIISAFIDGEHQQGFEGESQQYYNETYG